MSLFSKLAALRDAPKRVDDEVLLIHAMLLVAGADGQLQDEELATIEAFVLTMHDFDGRTFEELISQANKLVARYGSVRESVQALSDLSTPALKRKAFVLAADVSLLCGPLSARERALLTSLQSLLGVDDALAAKVFEVLEVKYAR
jgi:tellurite resistance protein